MKFEISFILNSTSGKNSLKQHGIESQIFQLREEMAELIVAISHFLRNDRSENIQSLGEECADVLIVSSSLYAAFGRDILRCMQEYRPQCNNADIASTLTSLIGDLSDGIAATCHWHTGRPDCRDEVISTLARVCVGIEACWSGIGNSVVSWLHHKDFIKYAEI